MKSNRKYNQEPKIIRYIGCDFNKELKHKRMGKNNVSMDNEEENKNSRINSNTSSRL